MDEAMGEMTPSLLSGCYLEQQRKTRVTISFSNTIGPKNQESLRTDNLSMSEVETEVR